MDEHKERPAGVLLQPLSCGADNVGPQTFNVSGVGFSLSMEGAIVLVEALVQSEAPIQDEPPYECGRVVPTRFQDGGKRHGVGWERLAVILNPVEERVSRGE